MNSEIKNNISLPKMGRIRVLIVSITLIVLATLIAHSFFLPSLKLINKSSQILDIYVPQYPYIVKDNKIYTGCCPSSRDIIEMGRKKGTLNLGKADTYSLNIGNLYYPYPEDFFMLEAEWRNVTGDGRGELLGSIGYRLLDSDEDQSNGICHVTATITDDGVDIKESRWRYCFKKITKDIGISSE